MEVNDALLLQTLMVLQKHFSTLPPHRHETESSVIKIAVVFAFRQREVAMVKRMSCLICRVVFQRNPKKKRKKKLSVCQTAAAGRQMAPQSVIRFFEKAKL